MVEILRGLAETVREALQLPEVLSSIPTIESPRNKRFKQWRRWVEQPQREDCPWIAVEGWRAISDLAAERPVELLLLTHSSHDRHADPLMTQAKSCFAVPEKLFRRLSDVTAPQGALAFFAKPRWCWEDLPACALYLDRLQDPGNLGTLLRTARATGGGIVAGPGTVSCSNSKAVRASAAAIFSVPCLESVPIQQVQARKRRIVAATLDQGDSLFEADLSPPLAVAIGNEGAGVGTETLEAADASIHIPMSAGAESLNAAVAGSLILYEVFRRDQKLL